MRFSVINTTRGGVSLGDHVQRADGWLARSKGLLGRRKLDAGDGLLLTPCNAVHMLFMRFAIDVAFLDGSNQVVRAVHRLRPWRMTRFYLEAQSALELPEGTLARTGTVEGDRLELVAAP